jgi:hypothetical protein
VTVFTLLLLLLLFVLAIAHCRFEAHNHRAVRLHH